MSFHKCRHPSTSSKFTLLNTHPMKVNKEGKLLWHIVNFTEDMSKESIILSMSTAINEWQEAFDRIKPVGRHIILESTSKYEEAHIKVVFCKKGTKHQVIKCADGKTREYNLVQAPDGTQHVLGFVESNREYIFMDDGDLWGEKPEWVNGIWAIVPRIVLKHELGHTFDIGHSNVVDDIMYASYDGNDKPLTYDTDNALQERWGPDKRFIAEQRGKVCPECPLINWRRIFKLV